MSKNMVLTWGPPCDFIFKSWQATEDFQFWLGVIACLVTCFLTTAYGPIFHKQIKMNTKNRLLLTGGFLGQYLLKIYVMLLMMTMNVEVCLAIAVGVSAGYVVFGHWGQAIRKKIFQRTSKNEVQWK